MPAINEQLNYTNEAYLLFLEIAIVKYARTILKDETAVASVDPGHARYIKRMTLANNVINTPKVYVKEFSRLLNILDSSAYMQNDVSNIVEQMGNSQSLGYDIWDSAAGVTALDLA